jgi:thiol-disulfide isomerase/thioredoxin
MMNAGSTQRDKPRHQGRFIVFRTPRIAVLALLVSLGLLGSGSPSAADNGTAAEGSAAVALTVSNWTNSKELKLADLKGKVVVLKFWATWCVQCKSTLPKFEKLAKSDAFKDKVVFIGIHDKKEANTMGAFLTRNKYTFPSAEDDTGATVKAYGVKQLPFNVIIDKKGNVKKLDAEIDDKELQKLVDEK